MRCTVLVLILVAAAHLYNPVGITRAGSLLSVVIVHNVAELHSQTLWMWCTITLL